MNSPTGYSRVQIALHWTVVALVAAQYLFNDAIVEAWTAWRQGLGFAYDPRILAHVAAGQLILILTGWRLVLRMKHGAPPAPDDEPAWLQAIARLSHASFYVVLSALSISGTLAWFGGAVPAALLHNLLKGVLLALIALHVLAALLHPVVLKTNVMRRMMQSET